MSNPLMGKDAILIIDDVDWSGIDLAGGDDFTVEARWRDGELDYVSVIDLAEDGVGRPTGLLAVDDLLKPGEGRDTLFGPTADNRHSRRRDAALARSRRR